VIASNGSAVAIMAIVHAADGVRCVATGVSSEAVASRVAEYVRERCDDVLWPDAASVVHAMLAGGNLDAAISLYFDRVGERWDEERLELVAVPEGRAGWTFDEERMAGA
jgi:hypothetical protein